MTTALCRLCFWVFMIFSPFNNYLFIDNCSASCYIYPMSITQTVEVPASHRLTIDVPREIPAGETILTFTPKAEPPKSGERGGFGCVKGDYWMADDFDAPLDDFKDYM
jgi:hypothetical protein